MTGYIIKDPCEHKPGMIQHRTIYQDIESKKHYVKCDECHDGSCMVEVDASYARSV